MNSGGLSFRRVLLALRIRLPASLNDVRLRFVVAGIWNTVFSWLMFALSWWALGSFTNLWVVSGVAHLGATTQSFFAQRHFVFRATGLPVWAQYFKFQWAYLGLLICGSFAVNALAAQGLHPLLAQILVFALLAICGFILGKNFIYDSSTWSFSGLLARTAAILRRHSLALAAFALSMLLFETFWGANFYRNAGKVGADFDLTAASLLEGKFWLDSNGVVAGLFNPPWFTPAWCGGAAFYADPQFTFYSPLQFLAYFSDPFTAAHWSSLLFAGVAFWGSYVLALKVMRWLPAPATVFSVLGVANGFLPEHSILGQLGYQPFYLWTWLALALCYPRSDDDPAASSHLWPSVGVALCLTGWLQFGFAGMLIPASLATMLFCLVMVVCERAMLRDILVRSAIGSIIALALNGLKIYESLSLLRNFPRDFYAMYGQSTLHETILMIARSLFQPTAWTSAYEQRASKPLSISPAHSEWAFQFGLGALALVVVSSAWLLYKERQTATNGRDRVFNLFCWVGLISLVLVCAVPMVPQSRDVVPVALLMLTEFAGSEVPLLLLVAAGGAMLLGRNAHVKGRTRASLIPWLGIAVIICIPVLLVYTSDWRDLIKALPILNTTTWTMRWIATYVPLAQFLVAWPLAVVLNRLPLGWTPRAALAASALIWLGPILSPMDYYDSRWVRSYDASPMTDAFATSRRTGVPIPVQSIEVRWHRWMYVGRNDSMLKGVSQGLCYNPIYGYHLESFPQLERLEPGPVLKADLRGQSLLRNPACLVHPTENQCSPGDGFTLADPQQLHQAETFLSRKPFDWRRPLLAAGVSFISQLTFWILLVLVLLRFWRAMLDQPPVPDGRPS